MYCNPNATYYEFSYFQTDWIELYVGAGVNLVMWNYRGYARSGGKPDLKQMKNDGECIIDYIRLTKKYTSLGIHGESLGGSIATHIAKASNADFLFADRTFASLSSTARFNFGKFAELIFRLIGPKDSSCAEDFLNVNCIKIVSCDCNDLMINNLGSLKTGIAYQYFQNNSFESFPHTDLEISNICKEIKKIQTSAKYAKSIHNEKKKNRKGQLQSSSMINNLLIYFQEIIENIDAGGESFIDLFVDTNEYSIKA